MTDMDKKNLDNRIINYMIERFVSAYIGLHSIEHYSIDETELYSHP